LPRAALTKSTWLGKDYQTIQASCALP